MSEHSAEKDAAHHVVTSGEAESVRHEGRWADCGRAECRPNSMPDAACAEHGPFLYFCPEHHERWRQAYPRTAAAIGDLASGRGSSAKVSAARKADEAARQFDIPERAQKPNVATRVLPPGVGA